MSESGDIQRDLHIERDLLASLEKLSNILNRLFGHGEFPDDHELGKLKNVKINTMNAEHVKAYHTYIIARLNEIMGLLATHEHLSTNLMGSFNLMFQELEKVKAQFKDYKPQYGVPFLRSLLEEERKLMEQQTAGLANPNQIREGVQNIHKVVEGNITFLKHLDEFRSKLHSGTR